jgi:hypothetical protein
MAIKNHLIQAYKQAPWRTATQNGALFLVGIFIVACMVWVMLTISVKSADAGLEIQGYTAEQLSLTRDIASTRSKIAEVTSTDQMAKRVSDMGFRPATGEDITYVLVPGYVGRQSKMSAPPPAAVLPPMLIKPSYTQSLSDWLWQSAVKLTEKTDAKIP